MLTVLGEAVVDLVADGDRRFVAHPGGSPLNVAVGLGRLAQPVTLAARLSGDTFGAMFRQHLAASHVDPRHLVAAAEPSTLAVATLDADGVATYDFWTEGTADWQWTAAELAGVVGRTPPSCTPGLSRWSWSRARPGWWSCCARSPAPAPPSATTRTCGWRRRGRRRPGG